MSNNPYGERTFNIFKSLEQGKISKQSLFKQASEFEEFNYVKNNWDSLLNMGIMYLDNSWQKKIIQWLCEFSDEYLINTAHIDEKVMRHSSIIGYTQENVLHLAIMFGKIDMVKFLLDKAKTTMPKLLDYGYHAEHSLLQIAILSQDKQTFDYIFNHLEHDFYYKNNKNEGALGNAIFNYPQCLEYILKFYSNEEINATIEVIESLHHKMHDLYHGKATLKSNLDYTYSFIEKMQLEKLISEKSHIQSYSKKI